MSKQKSSSPPRNDILSVLDYTVRNLLNQYSHLSSIDSSVSSHQSMRTQSLCLSILKHIALLLQTRNLVASMESGERGDSRASISPARLAALAQNALAEHTNLVTSAMPQHDGEIDAK